MYKYQPSNGRVYLLVILNKRAVSFQTYSFKIETNFIIHFSKRKVPNYYIFIPTLQNTSPLVIILKGREARLIEVGDEDTDERLKDQLSNGDVETGNFQIKGKVNLFLFKIIQIN